MPQFVASSSMIRVQNRRIECRLMASGFKYEVAESARVVTIRTGPTARPTVADSGPGSGLVIVRIRWQRNARHRLHCAPCVASFQQKQNLHYLLSAAQTISRTEARGGESRWWTLPLKDRAKETESLASGVHRWFSGSPQAARGWTAMWLRERRRC